MNYKKILEKILSQKVNREKLVNQFLEDVWNNKEMDDANLFIDLAEELEYYKPDGEHPREYFIIGDKKLEELITETLKKINS